MIGLTEKGKAIRPDFEEISMILKKKVYGDLPQAHRRQLMALLSTIALNLEN